MSFKSRTATVQEILTKNTWSKTLKPKITLTGNWLKEAGINSGDVLKIEVFEGKLIIKKA